MRDVQELRLKRPIEVCWDTPYPKPVITLRNPAKVKYDPEARMVEVDTGKGLVVLSVDEAVERMALAPGGASGQGQDPPVTPQLASASAPENAVPNPGAVATVFRRPGKGKP